MEKSKLAAERDRALAEAHRKYVEAVERARREYVEAKRRILPGTGSEETIKMLEEKVASLERQLAEKEKGAKK
jgi:proline dehydrogenase